MIFVSLLIFRYIAGSKTTKNTKDTTVSATATANKEDKYDVRTILTRCLDPPSTNAINQAESYLIKLQAIDPVQRQLTSLGRHLAFLPCSPNIGRLLIYGM